MGVFPNGVDLDYFSDDGTVWERDVITFLGRMDYYPNEQCMRRFCEEVLPLLRRVRPRLRLQLVGAEPGPAVRSLARLAGVVVSGTVPDVRPWVRRSALTVAPLHIARGTQNKILESMAMGVPVVCSAVAAAGVEAVPGEHLRVAAGARDWCEQILAIAGEPALRRRLGEAARAHVESHYAWPRAMARLDEVLAECPAATAQAGAAAP